MWSRFSIIKRMREKRQGKLKSKKYGLELEIRTLKREIRSTEQYAKHPVTLTSQVKEYNKAQKHKVQMILELHNKEWQLAAIERKLNK